MSRIIETRDGAEVFASDAGNVCIKQTVMGEREAVVSIHPDDIPQLIKALEEVKQEALHIRHDPPGYRAA
jgi:hypothetical protein